MNSKLEKFERDLLVNMYYDNSRIAEIAERINYKWFQPENILARVVFRTIVSL